MRCPGTLGNRLPFAEVISRFLREGQASGVLSLAAHHFLSSRLASRHRVFAALTTEIARWRNWLPWAECLKGAGLEF
jgi:hypothetical protein